MKRLRGNILTPLGFVEGVLEIDDQGRIAGVEGQARSEAEVQASSEPVILPGFIDLHVHGGGGGVGHAVQAGDGAQGHTYGAGVGVYQVRNDF